MPMPRGMGLCRSHCAHLLAVLLLRAWVAALLLPVALLLRSAILALVLLAILALRRVLLLLLVATVASLLLLLIASIASLLACEPKVEDQVFSESCQILEVWMSCEDAVAEGCAGSPGYPAGGWLPPYITASCGHAVSGLTLLVLVVTALCDAW